MEEDDDDGDGDDDDEDDEDEDEDEDEDDDSDVEEVVEVAAIDEHVEDAAAAILELDDIDVEIVPPIVDRDVATCCCCCCCC